MNVVYFAIGASFAEQAEMAAEALRLTNPDAQSWVLTDQDTQFRTLKPFRGHSSTHTLMYDRTLMQLQFLKEYGQALFLDSDCVVNKPLRNAFQGSVALTKRVPPAAVPNQIYNGGVLYGKGKDAIRFWQDWVDLYPQLERGAWGWWGDQMILPHLVPHHAVTVYESETHNFIPWISTQIESVLPAYIVHFKGEKRKVWLPIYLDTLKHGAQDLLRA